MPRQSVEDMAFMKVYPLLVQKAERKGRTAAEVEQVVRWLTGYQDLDAVRELTYGEFIAGAPSWNPRADEIRGTVCGVRVETIEDPMTRKIRQLDKLVDELAKGRPMEKILR